MERKILFKAKRLDNGEWVEGYYYKECDNTYIIEDRQKDSMLNRNEAFLVDPSTVCQFTGLTDDFGKPIYENDIVDFGGEGEILFRDGAFYVKFTKYMECLLSTLTDAKPPLKVICSKFDRKEGEV